MGGFRLNRINFSISIIIIANISLCGLPFIRGFYSKDLIIEIIIIKGKNLVIFILVGIFILLPFSIMGGIIISYNIIRTNKIIFIPFRIKVRLIIYFTFFNKNLIINKRIFK